MQPSSVTVTSKSNCGLSLAELGAVSLDVVSSSSPHAPNTSSNTAIEATSLFVAAITSRTLHRRPILKTRQEDLGRKTARISGIGTAHSSRAVRRAGTLASTRPIVSYPDAPVTSAQPACYVTCIAAEVAPDLCVGSRELDGRRGRSARVR